MNSKLLTDHVSRFVDFLENHPDEAQKDREERKGRIAYFQSWSSDRIQGMEVDDLYEYFSKLWAMLIWGNKRYVVDKIVENNGLESFRSDLIKLLWGTEPIAPRWDQFRKRVKGMGPAMMSELLCHTHPAKHLVWNRRAYVGFNYLQVDGLPRYDYQMDGERYAHLCRAAQEICQALVAAGVIDANLLTVDYFIWHELQVETNLSKIHKKTAAPLPVEEDNTKEAAVFMHNDVRDKLADIGRWLGFETRVETKVADGSKVDAVWEASIGNMGRVIYVFEVQTKGSIDSLIVNLLKSLNNPAVQGVVAVSDAAQCETIKRHAGAVQGLVGKLRYWDYEEVLQIHENLQTTNEIINRLDLVPQSLLG